MGDKQADEVLDTLLEPEVCDFSCQFEWLEISSNFFSISVYTPALVAGAAVFLTYRIIKKAKIARAKKH